MAPFARRNVEDYQRLDWQILRNGAVSLYFDEEIFKESCEWFRQQAYQVYMLDASRWKSPSDCYDEIALTLHIEQCSSLDALSDCFGDFDVPYESGCVLSFQHFDQFAHNHRSFAQGLLDVIQFNSRLHSLQGLRFLALVQVDDPHITFEPLGACPVVLNPLEWRRRFKLNLERAREHLKQSELNEI